MPRPRTGETRLCAACRKEIYVRPYRMGNPRSGRFCKPCRVKMYPPPRKITQGVYEKPKVICPKCGASQWWVIEDGMECLQCSRILYLDKAQLLGVG